MPQKKTTAAKRSSAKKTPAKTPATAAKAQPTAKVPAAATPLTDAEVYALVAKASESGGTLKAVLAEAGLKRKDQLIKALYRHCAETGAAPLPVPGDRGGASGSLSVSIRGLFIGRAHLRAMGLELPLASDKGSWPADKPKVRVQVEAREIEGLGPALVIHSPQPVG